MIITGDSGESGARLGMDSDSDGRRRYGAEAGRVPGGRRRRSGVATLGFSFLIGSH